MKYDILFLRILFFVCYIIKYSYSDTSSKTYKELELEDYVSNIMNKNNIFKI